MSRALVLVFGNCGVMFRNGRWTTIALPYHRRSVCRHQCYMYRNKHGDSRGNRHSWTNTSKEQRRNPPDTNKLPKNKSMKQSRNKNHSTTTTKHQASANPTVSNIQKNNNHDQIIKSSFYQRFLPTITRDQGWAIVYRLPLWVILVLLATSDRTSPMTLCPMTGPSMLPTIHPVGDLWLRNTLVWNKIIDFILTGKEDSSNYYQVGDIVIWYNDQKRHFACKRIIGVGGDVVKRHGEFVHLYVDQDDWGIPDLGNNTTEEEEEPKHDDLLSSPNISIKKDPTTKRPRRLRRIIDLTWDKEAKNEGEDCYDRTILIPKDHVWLEGDLPPLSYDSRHYGPVPIHSLRGLLILRLWPLSSREHDHRKRPIPISLKDEPSLLESKYNLHRKGKQQG